MTVALEIAFWASVLGIVYTYALYPLLVGLLAALRRRSAPAPDPDTMPGVSVVVSVFNEGCILREKLANLAALEYPADRIEFVFGSDGSTDETVALLRDASLPGLRLFPFTDRRGKSAVLNDLVRESRGEIIVFSDANTMYDPATVRRLVGHFGDPRIGGVCGELLLRSPVETAAGTGETSYWEYETRLKKWESAYATIVGATGGVYAIRRELFRPLPDGKPVVDDLLIPLEVVRRGYRVVYEPGALAYEEASGSIAVEFRRRARIGAQILSGMPEIADLLNPLRGFIALALWSHKILRWAVPLFAVVIFGASMALAPDSVLYAGLLAAGLAGSLLALAGWIAERRGFRLGIFGLPFYIVAMNVALTTGFVRALTGRQRTTWTVERTVWGKPKNG